MASREKKCMLKCEGVYMQLHNLTCQIKIVLATNKKNITVNKLN